MIRVWVSGFGDHGLGFHGGSVFVFARKIHWHFPDLVSLYRVSDIKGLGFRAQGS